METMPELTVPVSLMESGFKPGKKANLEIEKLVGWEADFCGSEPDLEEIFENVLTDFDRDGLIVLRTKDKKVFCVCEMDGVVLTTKAYKTDAQAMAAVVHYLLHR